jgi:hypothetical protein
MQRKLSGDETEAQQIASGLIERIGGTEQANVAQQKTEEE